MKIPYLKLEVSTLIFCFSFNFIYLFFFHFFFLFYSVLFIFCIFNLIFNFFFIFVFFTFVLFFIFVLYFFLGEVYISQKDFIAINDLKILKNETVFSTARNAAAGSLRHSGTYVRTFVRACVLIYDIFL